MVTVVYAGYISNDTSVFPMALFENVVARPIAYQGEKGRWKMRNSQLAISLFLRTWPRELCLVVSKAGEAYDA
jgi:hypothetical protein